MRVFEYAKGERYGEAHRASALAQAMGRYVAHINDDSLWFPDHLSSLLVLLDDADFVNVVHTTIDDSDQPFLVLDDLADAAVRTRMLETDYNFANLADVAYSMEAYRQLPQGWSPAPPDVWTDLYMWRKFLRCQDLRFATLFKVTTLFFGRLVNDVSSEALDQILLWEATLRNPLSREKFRQRVWAGVIHELLELRGVHAGQAAQPQQS